MNNNEFIAELASRTGLGVKQATEAMNALTAELALRLEDEDQVAVQQFGTFATRKRMERVVVNPNTRQRMLVPPKIVVTFKPSPAWKENVKGGGEEL